ncbi:MAG: EAL domain-containing response regulator [Pseudomonadales bacterium]|nr:EAL domain-containing response regulator [Pseudomonadales bacterium]
MENRHNVRVLLLDDDPFMNKLHFSMLMQMGFTSLSSTNSGQQALASMDRTTDMPHLIFLDLKMPHMDGIEFIRKLVERDFKGALILVSGEDERVLKTVTKLAKSQDIDVVGHLQKPITPKTLEALLCTWSPVERKERRKADRRKYVADELRSGINCGELINYYQPKVAVATGEVVGVEALVRWLHPDDGMIYPDQFIGIAEEHGLIDDLTFAVLKQALFQACVWRDEGLGLKVAINVSMDNLVALDFPDIVAELAAKAGIAPKDILLEVTESKLMRNPGVAMDILARLRLKRFVLSIDDFGLGHSSMAQLRDIPFDQLKVDKSFVHNAHADPTALAIYRASQTMATELGMEFVAEGVEDLEDWNLVRHTNCDIAQGYFIARPMPAADYPAWLQNWQQRLNHNFENDPETQ